MKSCKSDREDDRFHVDEDDSSALADDYQRRLDVVCRGFGGYTTAQAKFILPTIIASCSNIRLLCIFFGVNDAMPPSMLPHVPLQTYRDNLTSLITNPQLSKVHPQAKILIITPALVNEHDVIDVGRSVETKRLYAEAAKTIAETHGIACVDMGAAFMKYCGWKPGEPIPGLKSQPRNAKLAELLHDGLHFDAAGYQVLYHSVTKEIAKTYPELRPDRLAKMCAQWDSKPAAYFTAEDMVPQEVQADTLDLTGI